VREINFGSSAILFVYAVACAIVGRDAIASNLTVPTMDGHATHHVGFNCRGVFLYALLVESFVRFHAAVYPRLTTISFTTNAPTLRLFFMLFTFPAINAAVLVGVGISTSLWSVFSVVGMTLLLLCCSWMISVSSVQRPAVIFIGMIGVSLYLATWILAWLTSANGFPFGLICFVVAVIVIIISKGILQLARSSNGIRHKHQLELYTTCASLFVYILGQALWVATARTTGSTILSPWIAFIITGVVIIFFTLFATLRMPELQIEKAETELQKNLVADIDSDAENGSEEGSISGCESDP